METYLVSVIMPAFNAEKYIAESIESVRNQSYQRWELLIINDCSTDSTGDVVKSYAQKDQRIQYCCLDKNSGAAVARKRGIEKAKGRFIAFLDSDDVWLPEKLAKQIKCMLDNSFSFTCTQYGKIDEKGNILDVLIDDSQIRTYKDLLKRCPGNSTVIYDASKLGKIYPADIKKRNDYVLWLDVIKKSGNLYCYPELLAYHRLTPNSISSKKLQLIKYHWYIYREKEHLNVFYCACLILYWCFRGILRLLPYYKSGATN